jgi:type IV pilus assembly protein PilM
MAWFPFKFKKAPKNFLGVDIGTSAIKIVELNRKGDHVRLVNYGEVKISPPEETKAAFNVLSLSNQEIAKAIGAVLREAEIETKEVNFSIPDFSSFFTSFNLPPMSQKELERAVKYEARSYIPLPLSEITLDWQVVETSAPDKKTTPLKILVVAIPNEVVNQYQQISLLAGLQLNSLEAEIFAVSRPFMKNDEKAVAIIDIGARSTTCNIFEKGILKTSHSFNVSGNELTEILSRSLRIDYGEAEELKKKHGLTEAPSIEQDVKDVVLPLINLILSETEKTFRNFYQQGNQEIQKVLLAGGSALMPGLKEYLSAELKIKTEVANPFFHISFPPILDDTLKEMGPSYVIAVGLAVKGLGYT